MKTVIVVGTFVLVACFCLQENAALSLKAIRALEVPGPDGKFGPCDASARLDVLGQCVRYSCNPEGFMSVLGCGLVGIECEEGEKMILDEGPRSKGYYKKYPECCPRVYCGAA